MNEMTFDPDASGVALDSPLQALSARLADDTFAATFQSIEQYRSALLQQFATIQGTPGSRSGEAATARDAAFEEAMRQTWQMVDPIRPSGQPGSYNRGEYNGIVAALLTVRDNYERAKRAALSSTPGDGEQEVTRG